MKRRSFILLAAISLTLCATTICIWNFFPSQLIRFNFLGHQVMILSGPDVWVQFRIYSAGFINVSKNPNLSPGTTGVDAGTWSHFLRVLSWGSGYSIHNLTPNSPAIVPASPWRAVCFPLYLPAVLSGLCAAFFIFMSIKMRPHAKDHCRVCGYDLRATPDRCPECGTIPAKPVEVET